MKNHMCVHRIQSVKQMILKVLHFRIFLLNEITIVPVTVTLITVEKLLCAKQLFLFLISW